MDISKLVPPGMPATNLVLKELSTIACELIGANPDALYRAGSATVAYAPPCSRYIRCRELTMLLEGCEMVANPDDYWFIIHSSPSVHWDQFATAQFVPTTCLASEYNAGLHLMNNAAFQFWSLLAAGKQYQWSVNFVERKTMAHRQKDTAGRYNPNRSHLVM